MARADGTDTDETVARLAAELTSVASSERAVREELRIAHDEIGAREEELRSVVDELERARAERDEAYAEVASMKRTRLWRLGGTWWWLRDALRHRGR